MVSVAGLTAMAFGPTTNVSLKVMVSVTLPARPLITDTVPLPSNSLVT